MKLKLRIFLLLSFFTIITSGYLYASQNDHNHGHETAVSKSSPLVDEMLKLDKVFREVVSAVSLGDGKRVHNALEEMHGTMEKTHEGVHNGTVKLKKSSSRLTEFVRMDKEFHGQLEKLARASHKNDQNAMLSITKKLLDGCVNCHQKFRL